MADYQKMYSILCGAASDAIDLLKDIPWAIPARTVLQQGLWKAEETYLKAAAPRKPADG